MPLAPIIAAALVKETDTIVSVAGYMCVISLVRVFAISTG